MSDNRLNVISQEGSPTPKKSQGSNSVEAEAKYERLWLTDPEQFDPYRNIKERVRLERTWNLLLEHIQPNLLAVDLGSGWGEFSKRLAKENINVHAVDISSLALKRIDQMELVKTFKQYIPLTRLDDNIYDIVLGCDIIAYLPARDYRLFISEMARLVKRDGLIVCSTPIDINSEDALYRFNELAETEFQIDHWKFSYHRLWIRIRDFFEAPRRFVRASGDSEYRQRELKVRAGMSLWWFGLNSGFYLSKLWWVVGFVTDPIANVVKTNRWLLLNLESFCKFWWDEEGISHAIFVGKRRPLVETPKEDIPIERKGKRQVWE